ncbi:unnamed protein product [Cyprideis torosa]|uniref:Prolyl 4-hydroxylase alpha subunit Fe(2+) 2OG dioxygenase domain-containing protein n=1 Tax=Cyprideis torosa TaxID=163714 RepID=A0A7R8ZU00_9CRUS|nr:unnamed protein product [Cyprideis torosa]CAG0899182.1 unnamed protein product [Cyprideis torosa]
MTDVTAGGFTVFPHLNVTLRPEKGSAAFWYNLRRNGDPLNETLHAGCPVLVGDKWSPNPYALLHEGPNPYALLHEGPNPYALLHEGRSPIPHRSLWLHGAYVPLYPTGGYIPG